MALQLALTTLESLAEMLNERKRESEQAAAFQAKLRSTGSKLGKTDQARVLLREVPPTYKYVSAFSHIYMEERREGGYKI